MTESNPKCPVCKNEKMVKKLAKRGVNAGKYFWSCGRNYETGKYKSVCKGTINIIESSDSSDLEDTSSRNNNILEQSPSSWANSVKRNAWNEEFIEVGSLPSYLNYLRDSIDTSYIKLISQTSYLFKADHIRARDINETNSLISSVLYKILQRGGIASPTIKVEEEIISNLKISEHLEENEKEDLDNTLNSQSRLPFTSNLFTKYFEKDDLSIDKEFDGIKKLNSLFDDSLESEFINTWVPVNLGTNAKHWFIPQADMGSILESYGDERYQRSRIDFLLCLPNTKPIAIEIDGSQHQDFPKVDQERDDALSQCGIECLRISRNDFINNQGDSLKKIKSVFLDSLNLHKNKDDNELIKKLSDSIYYSSICSKIQFALVRALHYGWLKNNSDWYIEIKSFNSLSYASVEDLINMIISISAIYDLEFTINTVTLKVGNIKAKSYVINNNVLKADNNSKEKPYDPDVIIDVQDNFSSLHEVTGEANLKSTDIVIRCCYLPVPLKLPPYSFVSSINSVGRNAKEKNFVLFLNHIFRKKNFRDMQFKAILNIMLKKDSVVLLPTGAGKSIIYQLAGLLTPGITIVIDPIIALMEDQKEGLEAHGISRSAAYFSGMPDLQKKIINRGIENSEYYFIFMSPERLQSPSFRETIATFAQSTLINLCVIDEAHCVSEWGHDFRPAYLNLSKNIKLLFKDGNDNPPPIVALTGTASRAVLRDILIELSIDKNDKDSVIRPSSFDRKELCFYINKSTEVDTYEATIRGSMKALPKKFGKSETDFYSALGDLTCSGIIFVPHVNGGHGVNDSKKIIEDTVKTNATLYSGTAPKSTYSSSKSWDEQKRENAKEFKKNKKPILIATKAFGMGIDKPNIRYTLHLGIPSSLENFYQEAGRAGRDKKKSFCGVVFTEFDKDRTNSLLDAGKNIEDLKKEYGEIEKNKASRDDITRQLFFHIKAFIGVKEEIQICENILDEIKEYRQSKNIEITFAKDKFNEKRKGQEKIITRLVRCGVFEDYTVDYGKRVFGIKVNSFDLEKCKNKLKSYVISAQPGRVKIFNEKLNKINGSDNDRESILMLVRELILFTYDVIEGSRRRSLLEVVRLARNANDDKAIRTRLLDYLTEGVSSENLSNLVDNSSDLSKSINEFLFFSAKIDKSEAGEYRGVAERMLENYPDHPGLLVVRIIAESLSDDADIQAIMQDLKQLSISSAVKYGLSDKNLLETFEWMINYSLENNIELAKIIVLSLIRSMNENIIDDNIINDYEKIIRLINEDEMEEMLNIFDLVKKLKILIFNVNANNKFFNDRETLKLLG